jgi:GNAT superfamily N-acetyltransferase
MLADFERVSDFLDKQFNTTDFNGFLTRPFFEYAHTHPAFNHQLTHRFGIWEEDGSIIAFACYEMQLGQCLISVDDAYMHLYPNLVAYAEKELSIHTEEWSLGIWVTDEEKQKIEFLQNNGYTKVYSEPVNVFDYSQPFPTVNLPTGFSLINLNDENDPLKINTCLWKGFDHQEEPDDDFDCRLFMQSGPNFSKELTTVVKAPDGEYACFAGMWFNAANKFAYLEPLATVPEHRGKGLATAALVEGMKKTKTLGAQFCIGGGSDYYLKIGFQNLCHREYWKKTW